MRAGLSSEAVRPCDELLFQFLFHKNRPMGPSLLNDGGIGVLPVLNKDNLVD